VWHLIKAVKYLDVPILAAEEGEHVRPVKRPDHEDVQVGQVKPVPEPMK